MKRIMTVLAVITLVPAAAFADVSKDDILKLVKHQVGDDIILAFVRANSPIHNFTAEEIIELKQAGTSDAVLQSLMQRAPLTAQVAPEPAPAPVAQTQPSVVRETVYVQQPQVVYQSYPVYTPVYTPTYYYSTDCWTDSYWGGRPYYRSTYYHRPTYRSYSRSCRSGVSVSFGW